MHPIKILLVLLFGLYGCIGISIGVTQKSQSCRPDVYYANTSVVLFSECVSQYNATSISLMVTGCISMIGMLITCLWRES